ncbi:MAG: hypothetical protein Q8N26_26875 [Myxococcales bacterium]|nr:hypothetical protein [Myxococcales bacterium]
MLHALLLVVAAACPPNTFCNTSGPPTTGVLHGAAIRATDDAWVVGDQGVARRWDGKVWTTSTTGSLDTLRSVLPLGPRDVWVVGSQSVLHFDGAWSPVPFEPPLDGYIGALVTPRPGAIWVLGQKPFQLEGGSLRPLTGAASTFGIGGSPIDAMACGPDDVWALVEVSRGVVLHHWNGADVRVLRQPFRMDVGSMVCVDNVAWVSTDDSVLACTRKGCKAVTAPQKPRLLNATFGPMLISGDTLYLWRKDKFQPVGDAAPDSIGGAARSLDEVLFFGAHGTIDWFKGAAAAPTRAARLPFLLGVAATPDGKAWAISNHGVFSFANERWNRDDSFPGTLDDRQPLSIWGSSSSNVWIVAGGRAWRFDGTSWKPMTDSKVKTEQVWGRGPDDVYTFGESSLRHWNGAKWSEVAAMKPGRSGRSITGSATKVWALATDGRPDWHRRLSPTETSGEIIVLEAGKVSTLEASAEFSTITFGGGVLWATMSFGVQRLTDTGWKPVDAISGQGVVPTPGGALLLNGNSASEWNGKTFSFMQLPGQVVAGASAGNIVWLVGDQTALRRAP